MKSGDLRVIKYLIQDAKADLNQIDNQDFTPLLYSSQHGNFEALKYLVEECHADPH